MTEKQYKRAYEAIEEAIELGAMTWKQGMAKASMLALQYAAAKAERESQVNR